MHVACSVRKCAKAPVRFAYDGRLYPETCESCIQLEKGHMKIPMILYRACKAQIDLSKLRRVGYPRRACQGCREAGVDVCDSLGCQGLAGNQLHCRQINKVQLTCSRTILKLEV